MAKINLPAGRKSTQYVKFQGGFDSTTPLALMSPGTLIEAKNVEDDVFTGGYSVIDGLERFDGQTSPSAATYKLLDYVTKGTVVVGDTITGATSGATGVVLQASGGTFVLGSVTGTWVTELTTAGGASVTGPVYTDPDIYFNAKYLRLAQNNKRLSILAVPGENEVRGVVYYKGIVYAFRDALTPATGIIMYKATSLGWSSMAGLMGRRLGFTNANTSVGVGDVITQGGTTANILKLAVSTGTLASGVNAGSVFIDVPVGPGFAVGAATTTGAGALTLSSVGTAGGGILQTIANKGGKYDFTIANFGGSSGLEKLYASNPYNLTFEWDGTYLVNMNLGFGGGVIPEFNVYHKDRLFLTYKGSLIYSVIGDPYLWINDGGGEIAVGDNVTALMSQPGSDTTAALAVYCRNRTYVLYGTSVSDWNLVTFAEESGAMSYSAQKIGNTYVVDDIGITTLQTAQEFGNFATANIAQRIANWLNAKTYQLSTSMICRKKQQYRLFFNDGQALYTLLDKGRITFSPVNLTIPAYCSWSSETYGGGPELMFIGGYNGYVYQLDKGDTLDGTVIEWEIQLPYNDSGSRRVLKRYRSMTLDASGDTAATFKVGYKIDSGYDYTTPRPDLDIRFNDQYVNWSVYSQDIYNTTTERFIPITLPLSGVGDSLSIILTHSTTYVGYGKMKFTGALLETSTLRQKR